MAEPTRITVRGETDYDVVVGRRLGDELISALPTGAARIAVVHPVSRPDDGSRVSALVEAAGAAPLLLPVPDGESAKT